MSNEPIDLPVDEYRVRDPEWKVWRLTKLPSGTHIALLVNSHGAYRCHTMSDDLRYYGTQDHTLDILPARNPIEWVATYQRMDGGISRSCWCESREKVIHTAEANRGTIIETWARMSDGTLKRYYPE